MGLRGKIVSGFLILVIMLAVAGLWSIYELKSTGFSVQALLDDNYRSIHASTGMIEALERGDSAILLLMLGKWEQGRTLLTRSDSLFSAQLSFAYSNITVPGEKTLLDSIRLKYDLYWKFWQRPIVDTPREGNLEWYCQDVHEAFLDVKTAVQELQRINTAAMYRTASDLKQRSNRAVMPGLVAIIAAVLFIVILNYFVNHYMVKPIVTITDRVKRFVQERMPYKVTIETKDEIAELSESIGQLCQTVKSRDEAK